MFIVHQIEVVFNLNQNIFFKRKIKVCINKTSLFQASHPYCAKMNKEMQSTKINVYKSVTLSHTSHLFVRNLVRCKT